MELGGVEKTGRCNEYPGRNNIAAINGRGNWSQTVTSSQQHLWEGEEDVGSIGEKTKSLGEGEIHSRQTQRPPRTLPPHLRRPLPLGWQALREFKEVTTVFLEEVKRGDSTFRRSRPQNVVRASMATLLKTRFEIMPGRLTLAVDLKATNHNSSSFD